MIKKLILILSLFLISCGAKVDKDKLHLLNGYWEIDPKFNGTFETSNDAEAFFIRISNDSIFMKYTNDSNIWEEVLTSLDEKSFSVKNSEGVTYRYNRFEPINITP